jgi:phage-related protein
VEEFLDKLPAEDAARAETELALLAEFGTALDEPHVKRVAGDIWEVRLRGRVQRRILYVAISGRRMLLLHRFT